MIICISVECTFSTEKFSNSNLIQWQLNASKKATYSYNVELFLISV